MRKLILSLLMATAMVPAAASAQDRSIADRIREARAERAARSEASRPDERPQRAERQEQRQEQRVQRQERQVERQVERRIERQADRSFERQADGPARPVEVRRQRRDSGFLGGVRREAIEQRQEQQEQQQPGVQSGQHNGGDGRWTRDRDGRRDGSWSRDGRRDSRWSSDWRRDTRYDWSRHRARHRSIFRLGRYYDPYGWGYRRFSIGFSLGRGYYGSNYWLDDPWQYRLPPAYGPYRWVRYYDDALLVNIYDGRVVDVIHNFFW